MHNKDVQMLKLCLDAAKIFSTCGKRQYCAIIVDDRYRIVGMGYNGGPSGWMHCSEGGCDRFKANSVPGSNYDNCIAVHAEQNAFLNSVGDGKYIYVNGPPCFTCAKMIGNSGIEKVLYMYDPDYAYDQIDHILHFLRGTGVETEYLMEEELNASFKA